MKTFVSTISIALFSFLCLSSPPKFKFAREVVKMIDFLNIAKPNYGTGSAQVRYEDESSGKSHIYLGRVQLNKSVAPFLDIVYPGRVNKETKYAFSIFMSSKLHQSDDIMRFYKANFNNVNTSLIDLIFSFVSLMGIHNYPYQALSVRNFIGSYYRDRLYVIFRSTQPSEKSEHIFEFSVQNNQFKIEYSYNIHPKDLIEVNFVPNGPTFRDHKPSNHHNNGYHRGHGDAYNQYWQNGYKDPRIPNPAGAQNQKKESEMTDAEKVKWNVENLLKDFQNPASGRRNCKLLDKVKSIKHTCLNLEKVQEFNCETRIEDLIKKLSLVFHEDKLRNAKCDDKPRKEISEQKIQVLVNGYNDQNRQKDVQFII
jgi:hypothetical protein